MAHKGESRFHENDNTGFSRQPALEPTTQRWIGWTRMYGRLWNNLLQLVGDLININIEWATTNLGSTKTMVLFLMDVEEDN